MRFVKLASWTFCLSIGFAGAGVAQTDATPPADDPVICREQPAPTGSRIGAQKLCLKKSEWNDVNSQAQRDAERTGSWSAYSHSPTSSTAAPTATPHGPGH